MTMKTKSKTLNEIWGRKESAKAGQAMKLLLANLKFKTAVDALRIKWGVYGKDPQRSENIKKLKKSHSSPWKYHDVGVGELDTEIHNHPDSPYYKDLLNLMKRFKLDKNYWLAALWQYVRTGEYKQGDFYSETIPIIKLQKDEDGYLPKIALEIGRSTTLKDVKEAWYRVEELKKLIYGKQPKFKLWKNFERDSRAYELCLEGKTINEIDGILRKEYGADLDYGNIKKIISTYRKKLELPKEGKLITSRIKRLR